MADNRTDADRADTVESAQTRTAVRISPAAHLAAEMAAASAAGGDRAALREVPLRTQLGLRAKPGSASARALEGVLGFPLPNRVGEVTGDGDGLHVMWIGPDEFLAVDFASQQVPEAVCPYADSLTGLPGQAVDLSANRTILELSGTRARDVLEKSCRADLHPRVFGVGQAVTTALGVVPVILHHSGENTYRIYPRASFADFTVRWLLDGMAEFCSA